MKKLSALIVTIAVASGCAHKHQESVESGNEYTGKRAELNSQIEGFLDDERFRDAFWGVKIESLDTGEIWFEQNAEKIMMPASNEKIPSAAGALLELGPDFRFTTRFTTNGTVNNGILNGDLIAWSNGDPTHYTRFDETTTKIFEDLVTALKEKGITRINGRVIGNDNAFENNHIGYGWTYGGLDAWWSAPVGALQINENYVDLTITPPSTVDGKTIITPNVDSDFFQIVDNTTVVSEGRTRVSASREHGGNVLTVSGTVVAGGSATERSPAIENPTMFFTTVMHETIEKNEIEVSEGAFDIDDLPASELEGIENADNILFEDQSHELKDILKVLMKRSQNLYAETMPRVIAYEKEGFGSFSSGATIIKNTLSQFGPEPGSYIYADGSGLSRYNFISPKTLVDILKGMDDHEYSDIWKETMPIAGVDGTLSRRMKETPAEGNVRAKTGTISNVRGLSGYVTTAAGEEMVFSFLVNNHSSSSRATEDVTDGILALIAGYTE